MKKYKNNLFVLYIMLVGVILYYSHKRVYNVGFSSGAEYIRELILDDFKKQKGWDLRDSLDSN